MTEKVHIIPHQYRVSKNRERQNSRKGHVLWFTGLSGSGKSTVASAIVRELHQQGIKTFILYGDNVRADLNSHLDFSAASRREENIQRIAHVSALKNNAGLKLLTAFVSPYQKTVISYENVPIATSHKSLSILPLEVCEQRDVKEL